jgi:putative hydrolase of the HAD superfamily
MRSNICAVFDIDDTLYLERDYVRSGFEAVGHWIAKWIGVSDFAGRCWNSFLDGRRGSIFDNALRDAGTEPTPGLVSALVEIYRTHTPSISLAADALTALKTISQFASIAVISDGPVASQSRKVETLGLDSLAARVILTDTLGSEFRKPSPKAFRQIEQWGNGTIYVYVADNPLKDFEAPKKLGWGTVRVRRPHGMYFAAENSLATPDYEMPDCSNLPSVLSQL